VNGITAYFQPRPLLMLLLGFSAGLPFLLIGGTLSAWLREAGIDRSTIGFLSWIGFAYSFKFLWAPFVDQAPVPFLDKALGRRRAWMLVAQFGVLFSLVGFAFTQPSPDHLGPMIFFALLVAFSSATQDIVVDAWRIDAVRPEEQGVMSGAYQLGYRFGLIAAGAGALYIAEFVSWPAAYLSMAALMLIGVAATFLSPRVGDRPERTPEDIRIERVLDRSDIKSPLLRRFVAFLYSGVVAPFMDFVQRQGWALGLVILCLISTYRITDSVMGIMANPFYIDLGFSKDQIATVSKVYGIWVTVAGALFGGWAVTQFGMMRTLVLGAIAGSISNLLFAWMALQGPDVWALTLTISVENFAGGLAGTALMAYMSALTTTAFSATQYALFSSLFAFFGKFLGGFSGVIVDATSYFWFFVITAAMGVPAVLLSFYLWINDDKALGLAKEAPAPPPG
jgi:PAT family beta-lactamase induction signal transducer AmpG